MQFTVYEMQTNIAKIEAETDIDCIRFAEHFFEEYKRIYNECFYEMRKSLGIKPVCFLSDFTQIQEKSINIFLLTDSDRLVGSVACYGNEVDDLFVDKKYQGRGIGRQLLLWAMKYIRSKNNLPIVLHVAACNKIAVGLYKSVGFTITKSEIIE